MPEEVKSEGSHPSFYPFIDYRAHPAFTQIGVVAYAEDATVDGLVREIDASLDSLHATPCVGEEAFAAAFATGPERKIDTLQQHLDRTIANDRIRQMLRASIEDAKHELMIEARIKNNRHGYRSSIRKGAAAAAVASSLAESGIHISRLDAELQKRLRRASEGSVQRLKSQAKAQPMARVVETGARYSTMGEILNEHFEANGICQGLSHYFGNNVTFIGFSLEYSYPKQLWWRGLYADEGIPDSQTTYMHYDHGCKNPKAIVALSDFSEDTGPTKYVRGSHRAPRSNFLHFAIKSVDVVADTMLPKQPGDYYRSRFRNHEYRKEFMMLPRAFQACSHFGDDILDDSALSKELLDHEVTLTNDIGNCIAFDGDYGIHRGALVKEGERLAFQVIFSVEREPSQLGKVYSRSRAIARELLKGT